MQLNLSQKILIVEPISSVRAMLCDIFKMRGFTAVEAVATGKDALHSLETGMFEWLIVPFMLEEHLNVLSLLQLFLSDPIFRRLKVSTLYDAESDFAYLTRAFSLGLYSCHEKTYVREDLQQRWEDLFATEATYDNDNVLVSSFYLRQCLIHQRRYEDLLRFDQGLLSLYPGSTRVLINLAEAYALLGKTQEATSLCRQIELIDKKAFQLGVAILAKRGITDIKSAIEGSKKENVLRINSALVVDPDTDVLYAVRTLLSAAGVNSIETFESGDLAAQWLDSNPPPKILICEWRIPKLSGPFLVQRLRQCAAFDTLIMLCSSLVGTEDKGLLQEIGVDQVLEKPFDGPAFFRSIISFVQQSIRPTEQRSFYSKVIRSIDSGRLGEAERLLAQIMTDSRMDEAIKLELQAEYELANHHIDAAGRFALQALDIAPSSLAVLNLLGKIFSLKKDFPNAMKFFEAAQAQSPKNIERLIAMSVIGLKTGALQESEKYVNQASSMDSSNNHVLEQQAAVKLSKGDEDGAKSILSQLEKGERFVSAMNARAIALVRLGRFEEGLGTYRDTLRVLPTSWKDKIASVQYNLALGYARYGDLDQAKSWLEKSIKSAPKAMGLKAHDLLRRVHEAMTGGSKLQLKDSPLEESVGEISVTEGNDKQESVKLDLQVWLGKLEILRGDRCCYQVYICDEKEVASAEKLLKHTVHFVKRDAIQKGSASS